MFKNDLHIQIDGPRNSSEKIAVEQCYEIAMKFENESTEKVFVSKNKCNQGLAKSVMTEDLKVSIVDLAMVFVSR